MSTRVQPACKLLGVELTPPSFAGLLRMLGFLLLMVFVVQVADALRGDVWASEGALALIVGTFSGFLLNESGACFARHGWRAFALMIGCSSLIFATASLIV
jgi:hypothetical protein